LDPKTRAGRPPILTAADKDQLVKTVKTGFKTRRMKLIDIRQEAGLGHVSDASAFRALIERGIHAYREEFKPILDSENKAKRLVCTINL